MKRQYLLFFILFCSFISKAQVSDQGEYRIDASQRPANSMQPRQTRQVYVSDSFGDESSAVLINKKLYKASVLSRLLPYLADEKSMKSLVILKDETDLRRYTDNKSISRLIAIKLSSKLARQLKRQYREFAIN
jgi:hypothetical protein